MINKINCYVINFTLERSTGWFAILPPGLANASDSALSISPYPGAAAPGEVPLGSPRVPLGSQRALREIPGPGAGEGYFIAVINFDDTEPKFTLSRGPARSRVAERLISNERLPELSAH